jgi:hypothetical protein
MLLSRDQILNAPDLSLAMEAVEVSEWGGSVNVRVMTGTERGRFEEANRTAPKESIRARLAAVTICDEEGNLLFSDDDVHALGCRSSVALDRVFAVALKLNAIGPTSVEDEAKNS